MGIGLAIGLGMAAACVKNEARPAGRYIDTISFENENRKYTVIIPKNYDHQKPAPMVVALHGLTSSMEALEAITRIGAKANEAGFIAVVPNGTGGLRGWNTGFFKMGGGKDDVAYLDEIIKRIRAEFNVDSKRVHLFGHSNGAMMAYYYGALRANTIASVAGVAGTVGIPNSTSPIKQCPKPVAPLSVLMIHGEADGTVAFKPGAPALLACTGALDGMKWWAKELGLEGDPVATENPEKTFTTYALGPKNGIEVKLIATKRGNHDIPGGNYARGQENAHGLVAMDVIWQFFEGHPKP